MYLQYILRKKAKQNTIVCVDPTEAAVFSCAIR